MLLMGRIRLEMLNTFSKRILLTDQVLRFSTANNCTLNVSKVKPFEEIPGPRGVYMWPIIGSALHFKPFTNETGKTIHRVINNLIDKYGPILKYNQGQPLVVISDPKDFETIFQNEGKYPERQCFDIAQKYAQRNEIGRNLAQVTGEDWYSLRAPLNKHLMKVDSALHYLQVQNEVADEFVHILATEKLRSKDLGDLFFRYTAESVGTVCFNTRLGFLNKDLSSNQHASSFLTASKDSVICLQQAMSGESTLHRFYRNKTYRDFEKVRQLIREHTRSHINNAKLKYESRKRDGALDPEEANLLYALLSDKTLSYDDTCNIMEGLYDAGTDSTAKTLQTFLYNLAKNADKQEILREEVLRVLGKDQPLTGEALNRMPYLKASLKESFRLLYPLGFGIGRIIPTDVILSGYRVPAKTHVSMFNLRPCRACFSKPDEYLPERWIRSSDGRHQEAIPKAAVLPFGYGTRSCIGRRFAEQEIYLAIAKILQKLKVDIEPESYNTQFVYTIFIEPEEPINFKFTKLDS